jgi:tetratricopeptide (TPR) repeat protein
MPKSRWILTIAALCFWTWLIGISILHSMPQPDSKRNSTFEEKQRDWQNQEMALQRKLESPQISATDSLKVLRAIAEIQWQLREFARCETSLSKALAIQEKVHDSSIRTADLLLSLASVQRDSGNYAAAESSFKRALVLDEKSRSSSREMELSVAKDKNNLGTILYLEGTSSKDQAKKMEFFNQARSSFADALSIYSRLQESARADTTRRNLLLLERDLGTAHH